MPDKGREQHIDQQLRQSLGGQAFPTPEGSWDRIAQSLDRRARRKAWYLRSAAALAVMLIGSGLWFTLYNKGSGLQSIPVVQHKPSAEQPEASIPAPLTPPSAPNRLKSESAETAIASISSGVTTRPKPASPSYGSRQQQRYPANRLPGANNNGSGNTSEKPEHSANDVSFLIPEGLPMQRSVLPPTAQRSIENSQQFALNITSPRRAMQQQPALRLGIGSTPAFTLDVLQTAAEQAGFLHQDYIGIRRAQEVPIAALSAGLDLSLRLRKGIVLQTGAWLQEYSLSQRYDYRIANIPSYRGGVTDIYGNKLIEAYFTSANPEQVTYNGRSRYRSLRIPIQAGWSHSIGKGFDVVGLGGIGGAFLLEESGRQINYSNLSLSNNALLRMRKLQWSALVQAGIEKSLSRHLWLGTSLRWEAALHNRYIQGSPLRSTPRQTGILFNLQYRIY